MKHKEKLRIARRSSMAPKARFFGYGPFGTPQWESRRKGRATEVRKKYIKQQARIKIKKEKLHAEELLKLRTKV
jgi:hypothetical protein